MDMRELTLEQQDRIIGLIQVAHEYINHPSKAGPKWATYEAKKPRLALDALWEAHLLLTGCHLKKNEESENA